MRLRTTLLLLVALLALVGAYWGLQQRDFRHVRESEAAKQFFDWKPAQIQRLEIARVGEVPAAAERVDGDAWRMVLPNETIPPLNMLWERVATALAGLRSERTLTEIQGGPEAYGLAQPALTVTARLDDATEVKAVFGDMDPTQTYRFAQLDGGDMFLANKDQFFELNRSLQELRHRFLVDNRDAPIVRLELARIYTGREETDMEDPPAVGEESAEKVVLERENAESLWVMSSPIESAANQEIVGNIVKEMQFAVGRSFVDAPEALSDYGLQPANWRVSVVALGSETPQTILIGDISDEGGEGKESGLYVKRADRPAVFVVDAHLVTLLPKTPDAYRERRLFTGNAKDIQSFTYQNREGSITIVRNDKDAWEIREPAVQETNQLLVSQFIGGVMSVSAVGFKRGTPEEYGLNDPQGTLTLQLKGREAPVVLRWVESKDEVDIIYATLEGGAIGQFTRGSAGGLLAPLDAFRSREIVRVPVDAAQRLELNVDGQAYVLEKAHGKWVVVAPAGHVLANQTDAENLVAALNPLRAEAIEPPGAQPEAALGFDSPAVTLRVTLAALEGQAAPTVVGPLQVGGVTADNSQQRFARIEGSPEVYRVSQAFVTKVRDAMAGLQAVPAEAGN